MTPSLSEDHIIDNQLRDALGITRVIALEKSPDAPVYRATFSNGTFAAVFRDRLDFRVLLPEMGEGFAMIHLSRRRVTTYAKPVFGVTERTVESVATFYDNLSLMWWMANHGMALGGLDGHHQTIQGALTYGLEALMAWAEAEDRMAYRNQSWGRPSDKENDAMVIARDFGMHIRNVPNRSECER